MNYDAISIPKPNNDCAEEVCNRMFDTILPAYTGEASTAQSFATQCVIEANQIDVSRISHRNCYTAGLAAYRAAVIGLPPGPTNGYCFFVPRQNRVQLEMGYPGFVELAYESGFLKNLSCDVVMENEVHDFEYGTDTGGAYIHHKKPYDRKLRRDGVVGAYCLWHSRRGGHDVVYMSREDIDRVDTNSKVWRDDYFYIGMAQKSPLRKAAKMWPKRERLGAAIMLDEQFERSEKQTLGENLDASSFRVDLDLLDENSKMPESADVGVVEASQTGEGANG